MSKRIILISVISLAFPMLLTVSCTKTETENQVNNHISEKISSQLLAQVNLRKEQIAEPSSDRLELMKNMGMRVDKLEIQRIFIHLEQAPNTSQIEELKAMGVTLYLDSWIPPVGAHPYGVLLADMPVDKLDEVVFVLFSQRDLETYEKTAKEIL